MSHDTIKLFTGASFNGVVALFNGVIAAVSSEVVEREHYESDEPNDRYATGGGSKSKLTVESSDSFGSTGYKYRPLPSRANGRTINRTASGKPIGRFGKDE